MTETIEKEGGAVLFRCRIDEAEMAIETDEPRSFLRMLGAAAGTLGARTLVLNSYAIPAQVYEAGLPADEPASYAMAARIKQGSAAAQLRELGSIIWYADRCNRTSRKRRIPMDVEGLVAKWKAVIVGLALAHDKDEADRHEASLDDCLTPILSAPIAQVREFGAKLLSELKGDRRVPYLVWRAYEVWISQMKAAPDEDVKELKTDLARQIVELCEEDAKRDLPAAMVRALQWRSAAALGEVREVIAREKAAGRPARLQGRESCLFLEAGGSIGEPEVCIQV